MPPDQGGEGRSIALVDKAKANGFTGIKFYGTFNPAWLRASIAEAHKLGRHVHGHIPAGIRPMDAIDAGYDEITHINWVMMQAMPQSVIDVSNGFARFEGPGRYAKEVDLNRASIADIVDVMARKHIYSDPTMVAFESIYMPENGELSPSYAPFVTGKEMLTVGADWSIVQLNDVAELVLPPAGLALMVIVSPTLIW